MVIPIKLPCKAPRLMIVNDQAVIGNNSIGHRLLGKQTSAQQLSILGVFVSSHSKKTEGFLSQNNAANACAFGFWCRTATELAEDQQKTVSNKTQPKVKNPCKNVLNLPF